ncbi:MAG: putative ABC transporter ATP-binding protein [Candidatus Lokiarchaeum sp. GC14_75]|nr:MAG: putative ABC transporter ATP-binding protein [Candidatus Lokiarchaeum sp. GC14_75]
MSKFFGLGAEDYDRIYSDRELFSRILKLFKPHRRSMIIVIIFITLSSVTYGLIPYLMSLIIKQLESPSSLSFLIFFIINLFLLNSLGFVFNYVNRRQGNRMVYRVCYNLRRQTNLRVLEQDLSFFDKFPTGKIVSRINSDGQKFGGSVTLFTELISSFLIFFIVLIPMLLVNPLLTGVFMLMVPIVFLFAVSFRKVARKKSLYGQRSLAQVNAFVQESMAGIQIIKSFRQEKSQFATFQAINNQSFKVNMSRALFLNILFPSLDILIAVLYALLIFFGGNFIVQGTLDAGDIYLFLQSSLILFEPLLQMASFWPQFQDGMSAAERIFALQDSQSYIKQGDYITEKIKGEIEFDSLEFEYSSKKPVFKDFNLKIQPGETIAIVGHTGAGKSSLTKVLLRLYEFQSGDVRIDGHSIRDISLKEYRRQIGFIPQTPFLWADTIENNVKYGSINATREQVIWAIEQTGGIEWVNHLDKGLETYILERGKVLSMGQRQLIVFARVLLQNPSILILDEATASVDPFTELKIQEAMEKIMKGRTTIIIAHRLTTVKNVDRIIVIEHGKIVEEGNHNNLMKKKEYYARLYNTYFRHQSYEFLSTIKNK